jgi:hypothetical protein
MEGTWPKDQDTVLQNGSFRKVTWIDDLTQEKVTWMANQTPERNNHILIPQSYKGL